MGLDSQQVTRHVVGEGYYNWYEVRVDPENARNSIICGMKVDSEHNAFVGFVYASSDGGGTWRLALEDKNSAWVSEQSCAFGTRHWAYFISEASKVIAGETHHDLGKTRLYTSTDGGQHWVESLKTAWADHSTSAVSSTSRELFTFFNSGPSIIGTGDYKGTTVGLLTFSADGKHVRGPFYNSGIASRGYHGTYPRGAIALKSGAVVAFFTALGAPSWEEADLGIILAAPGNSPALYSTTIAHIVLTKDCPYTGKFSLAYDSKQDRLFLIYGDGCKTRPVMLTSSDDEGKTWSKSVPLIKDNGQTIYEPSLVSLQGGVLGLMWRDGERPSRWFYSTIRDYRLAEPAVELSHDPDTIQVSNDALWSWCYRSESDDGGNTTSEQNISVHLALNNVMSVLKSDSLVTVGGKVLAVWPFGSSKGMGLYSAALPVDGSSRLHIDSDGGKAEQNDVTGQTVLLYGGRQYFDATTDTFELDLTLLNVGNAPIYSPIKLEVTDVHSGMGDVRVLDANNGRAGRGAIWNITDAIVGDRLPPHTASKPFRLRFHIEVPSNGVILDGPDLLNLRARVFSTADPDSTDAKKPQLPSLRETSRTIDRLY